MPSNPVLGFWQRYKALGYDAASSRSVLGHFLHAWYYWYDFRRMKSHRQFCASASTLARRALRGWRRWTIRTRLFAPSWQRCRIQPHWLPSLPASEPLVRRRPQITSLPYLEYGRKFWKGKSGSQQELAAAAYRCRPSPLALDETMSIEMNPIGKGRWLFCL